MTAREIDLVADEAWAGYQAALTAVQRYGEGIVPSAESAAELSGVAYRAGEVSLLEVLDAHRVLLEVKVEEADAQLELQLAVEALRAMMGETNDGR